MVLRFLKNNLLILFFFILAIILPNIWIPKNYLYLPEEDIFINYQKTVHKNLSSWDDTINGGKPIDPSLASTIIPNGIFYYIGSILKLSNYSIQKIYISTVIFLSFISIYLLLYHFVTKKPIILLCSVLFYYLNFYIKSTPFYSGKMFQIILSPLLFLSLYQYLKTGKFRFAIYNFLLFFFCQAIFSNLAALAATFLVYLLAFLNFFVLEFKSGFKFIIAKIFSLISFFLLIMPLIFFYALIYFYSFQEATISELKLTSNFTALSSLLHLVMQFRGAWWEFTGFGISSYNPWLWFYSNFFIVFISFILFLITILPFLIKKVKVNSIYWLFIFLITLFLTSGGPFFPQLYKWMYKNLPFFFIFREPWAKFSPLLILSSSILLAESLNSLYYNTKFKLFPYIVLILILIRGLPFFTVDFFPKNSQRWYIPFIKMPSHWQKWNTQSIKYKNKNVFLIPNNYFKRNWYREDFGNVNHALAHLLGFTNVYWNIKNNLLGNLINYFISRNSSSYLKIIPVDYALIQSDVDLSSENFTTSDQLLSRSSLNYFNSEPEYNIESKLTLVPILPEKKVPLVFTAHQIHFSRNLLDALLLVSKPEYNFSSIFLLKSQTIQYENLEKLKLPLPNKNLDLSIKYLSPTKYEVSLTNIQKDILLVFNKSYNSNWHIYFKDSSNVNLLDNHHLIANGYANSWFIEPKKLCQLNKKNCSRAGSNYKMQLIIEYLPQKILSLIFLTNLGIVILSLLFLIGSILFPKKNV